MNLVHLASVWEGASASCLRLQVGKRGASPHFSKCKVGGPLDLRLWVRPLSVTCLLPARDGAPETEDINPNTEETQRALPGGRK